ncbi:MAG: heavy-metal-associated domain-containing protein [Ignavibacteria bacterium]|nr:heavy-metal-associated domain-containing protein [Ignavibacteria bacterium]
MAEKILTIENMSCHHCVMAVQKELGKLPLNSFSVEIGSAKVNYDELKTTLEDIEKAVEEAGYKVRKD